MIEYKFYLETYCGSTLTAEEWPEYCRRAEVQLAKYKRIYTVTAPDENAEALAVCAMADAMAYFTAAQNGAGGVVSSASIGSVSVSYNVSTAVDLSAKGQAKELYRCACMYLNICRGVC